MAARRSATAPRPVPAASTTPPLCAHAWPEPQPPRGPGDRAQIEAPRRPGEVCPPPSHGHRPLRAGARIGGGARGRRAACRCWRCRGRAGMEASSAGVIPTLTAACAPTDQAQAWRSVPGIEGSVSSRGGEGAPARPGGARASAPGPWRLTRGAASVGGPWERVAALWRARLRLPFPPQPLPARSRRRGRAPPPRSARAPPQRPRSPLRRADAPRASLPGSPRPPRSAPPAARCARARPSRCRGRRRRATSARGAAPRRPSRPGTSRAPRSRSGPRAPPARSAAAAIATAPSATQPAAATEGIVRDIGAAEPHTTHPRRIQRSLNGITGSPTSY